MENQAPNRPDAPALLYRGQVMHARLRPMSHRFTYRVLNLLIDLDRLDEADRLSRLFRVNRRGLFSFHERDHGPRDGTPLRVHAQRLAASAGIDLSGARVRLLCYPRLLGYAFTPLSVYYCQDRKNRLILLIYEVRNTFGDLHSYVCPVLPGQASAAGIRQHQAKQFYVSPFIGMAACYHFRLTPPGDRLKVRILETGPDGPLLAASFHGHKRDLTTRHLVAAFLSLPLVSLKVIGAIHFEAARLWLKGARLQARPQRKPEMRAAKARLTEGIVPDTSR